MKSFDAKQLMREVNAAASKSVEAGLNEWTARLLPEIPSNRKKTQRAVKTRMRRGSLTGLGGVIFPQRDRETRHHGVGISANTVHWLIYGTAQRHTRKGYNRGRMPGISSHKSQRRMQATARQIVERSFGKHQDRVRDAVTRELARGLAGLRTQRTTIGG